MANGVMKKNIPNIKYFGAVDITGGWTCPVTGFCVLQVSLVPSSGTGYVYVKNMTLDIYVGMIAATADGLSNTVCFPVLLGHRYDITASNKMGSYVWHYYQFY